MYELYEKVFESVLDERLFTAAVINWLDAAKENPFKENTPERQLFFKAKKYNLRWRAGGIDMRSSKRNMVEMAKQIVSMNIPNPYAKEEIKQTKVKITKQETKITKAEPEITKTEPAEIKQEELKEDIEYLMACMVNAYNNGDNASYEMYVIHLMETAQENPFVLGSDEYEMFSTMKACFTHNPPNKRRTFVVGKQLCDLINNTEIKPQKQTVLGVLPEEKTNWLKFLFPWKKDGELNDGARLD